MHALVLYRRLRGRHRRQVRCNDGPVLASSLLADRATAERIQLGIEYDPRPPFGGIDWSRVGEAERARQRQGGTRRRLNDARRLLG